MYLCAPTALQTTQAGRVPAAPDRKKKAGALPKGAPAGRHWAADPRDVASYQVAGTWSLHHIPLGRAEADFAIENLTHVSDSPLTSHLQWSWQRPSSRTATMKQVWCRSMGRSP